MKNVLVLGLVSCAAVVGCTIKSTDKNEAGAGADANAAAAGDKGSGGSGDSAAGRSGSGAGGAGEVARAGNSSSEAGDNSTNGDAGGPASDGSFSPSNIPAVSTLDTTADAVLSSACTIDGMKGTVECSSGTPAGLKYQLIEQTDPDHSKLAVFSARNITVETAALVTLVGPYPIALVAQGTLRVNGTVVATEANASGFAGVNSGPGNGPGKGDGIVVASKSGPGGAGFCGAGGPGGGPAGPASNGGVPYGDKTLRPLLGGSSGGSNEFGGSGGGGGAIQLFAGVSLEIGSAGVVAAPGGSGGGGGGAGGGSGGAVLLEAPAVRIAGIVTANGGGGGAHAGSGGERGRLDANAAKGGAGTPELGGDGSAGDRVAGAPGVYGVTSTSGSGGGGGGGAGWIRINTASGQANITGTLSPSLSTSCATMGVLGT